MEDEETSASDVTEDGEDDELLSSTALDAGRGSSFLMQEQDADDFDNVEKIFSIEGVEEEKKVDDFKEGEEAGLSTIREEGEEEGEFPLKAVSHLGLEEEEEEEEGEDHIFGEGEEELRAVAERVSVQDSILDDNVSREVEVKEVGIQNRYIAAHSQTDVSGDFLQGDDELYARPRDESESYVSLTDEIAALAEELEEEEEEEIESDELAAEDEAEEEYMDREPYYELFKSIMKEYPMLKMKNNFLQRKMAEYFKKRKMEHVLRESERVSDAQDKYYRKLDTLWELRNTNNMQRTAITSELNEMKALRDKQVKSVVENFEAMQMRERDIGKGLIFTKTAKEIPEKFLDRLLKNQRTKSKEIMDMRLCYIKLRNNIEEITAAIKAMDKIGENHTLIDYEQLKMENQNHADKIEERDEELSRLRTKCAAAIQTLAHLREKSSSTDIDILEMNDRLDEIELERNDWRERVNQLKKERDTLRANIVRLQEESGLLTKPKLLLDMEETLEQINTCKQELERIHATYKEKAMALDAIKRNIEDEKEYYHPKKSKNVLTKPKVWKGKPKLVYPALEKFNVKEFQK